MQNQKNDPDSKQLSFHTPLFHLYISYVIINIFISIQLWKYGRVIEKTKVCLQRISSTRPLFYQPFVYVQLYPLHRIQGIQSILSQDSNVAQFYKLNRICLKYTEVQHHRMLHNNNNIVIFILLCIHKKLFNIKYLDLRFILYYSPFLYKNMYKCVCLIYKKKQRHILHYGSCNKS